MKIEFTSVLPITSIVIVLGDRSLNTKPKFLAADTNAASSGDCACKGKVYILLSNYYHLLSKIALIKYFKIIIAMWQK